MTALNARDYDLYHKGPPAACYEFRSHNIRMTQMLGAAFAGVVRNDAGIPAGRVLRIGLSGAMVGGKSAFAEGLLNTVSDKICLERAGGGKGQALWDSRELGLIRHYDALCRHESICLTSYWNNHLETGGRTLTDIVEHPGADKNNLMFDCIVILQRHNGVMTDRLVTAIPSPEIARSQGFRNFLTLARTV